MSEYQVSELFDSIQGEGTLVGVPSAFVRLTGCNLRCSWCFVPGTPVLMADLSWKDVADLHVGDGVLGQHEGVDGGHRYLAPTVVEAVRMQVAEVVDVVTAEGTLRCTPDHKFWNPVQGGSNGWRSAAEYAEAKASGYGSHRNARFVCSPTVETVEYRIGYVAGVWDGDGTWWTLKKGGYGYRRGRLAMNDVEAMATVMAYFGDAFPLYWGRHSSKGFDGHVHEMQCLYLTKDLEARKMEGLLKDAPMTREFARGYLAGIFDAEGSFSGVVRLSQCHEANPVTFERIASAMVTMGYEYEVEEGGMRLRTHEGCGTVISMEFLGNIQPKVLRKLERVFCGGTGFGQRQILDVCPVEEVQQVVTVKTQSGSFVAGGFVVKNCDTPYASWEPVGKAMSCADLGAWVRGTGRRHVVLTGGEPMVQDLAPLLEEVRGLHVTVETAGTRRNTFGPVSLMSLSPKLSNSDPVADPRDPGGAWLARHRARRRCPDVVADVIARQELEGGDWQLKFVVQSDQDLAEVEEFIAALSGHLVAAGVQGLDPLKVFLMPEGRSAEEFAAHGRTCAELCKAQGWRLSPRLHVDLWGNRRGV